MNNYFEDDFEFQPKFKNGAKLKGGGGGSKKNNQIKRKKSSSNVKEVYNSKHIRIQTQKMEKAKLKAK